MFEQLRGYSMGGAKHGATVALARLELNPNDAKALSRIADFYDDVGGGDGEMFSYPPVAFAVGKYWDNFSAAQRDHLLSRLKSFSNLNGHGTENHALMQSGGGYLFSQYWPNESGWLRGRATSAQLHDETRRHLLAAMRSLYDKGYVENLSTTYLGVHLMALFALYDHAADPEVKGAADAAICFHLANLAANQYEGVVIPPFNRGYGTQSNTRDGGLWVSMFTCWLFWGEALNWAPRSSDNLVLAQYYLVNAAVSKWALPTPIHSLALGQNAPYALTSACAHFGYWGEGDPAECIRYVYRDKTYAMGSGAFRYDTGEYYIDYDGFGIIYDSPDAYNSIYCFHQYWRSDELSLIRGLNSPFMQTAQYQGTAIALFNIPKADPWASRGRGDWWALRDGHAHNLIKETIVRYPKSIDEKVEAGGWVFLREGDVYIAIRPLKDYTIDTADKRTGQFDLLRSAHAQTGFVFDIATKEEEASFEAFRGAIAQRPLTVNWDRLSVTYTSFKNDVITSTWHQPDYSKRPPEFVLVRPDITVNADVVPLDTTWPVLVSPPVNLIDRVLTVQTPAGKLTVDWREEAPQTISTPGGRRSR